MSAFKNTLKSGDQVFDIARKRRGIVHAQPREKSVMISVIFDETTTPKPTYVGDLQFVVPGNGGKHEDDPPIEGELPPRPETAQVPRPTRPVPGFSGSSSNSAINQLAERRVAIAHELDSMNGRAKELRAEDDKLARAIEVLKA
jgi:hypothetical protein